jgi:sorting nexin-13
MWYADITSDGEFPEQIRDLIMDALAEVSVRVKEINIVDLLTRYIVLSCFYEERDLGSY